MEEFAPLVIVPFFFGTIAYIVRIVSDNRIRRRLIESGQIDEKIKFLYFPAQKSLNEPFNSVRWGLVSISLGLAVIIGQQFPEGEKEQMTLSAMFLLAGIAFLVYYLLAKRELKHRSQSNQE
jgi:hypothetical protein